jgi:hypothetical protein
MIVLIAISAWAAVDRRDWMAAAVCLAAVVAVFVFHRLARRANQETAEKLWQVNALLEADGPAN